MLLLGGRSLGVRPPSVCRSSRRTKTVRFKENRAPTQPLRSPRQLALEHFDFYYEPRFGREWHSIRLGLLAPKKYIAVVNNFSSSHERYEKFLASLGASSIVEKLTGQTAEERLEERRLKKEAKAKRIADDVLRLASEEEARMKALESGEELPSTSAAAVNDEEHGSDRGESGIHVFREPTQQVSRGQLQLGAAKDVAKRADVNLVTGWEGADVRLQSREHFIYYPRALRLMSYDRGVFEDFPSPWKDENGTCGWWLLDGASAAAILALGLERGDRVLDLCAAPGGKTLLMLQTLLPDQVVANEWKPARLGDLRRSLTLYIPPQSVAAQRVSLQRLNASDLASWPVHGLYDKVLADVPCSTDKLAASFDEGNMWAPKHREERLELPALQTRILVNAIRSARPDGGSILYSTCTLASEQNEAVVENAVAIAQQRYGIQVVEESLDQLRMHLRSSGLYKFVRNIRRGSLILPFVPSNFGPMFMCKLTRIK